MFVQVKLQSYQQWLILRAFEVLELCTSQYYFCLADENPSAKKLSHLPKGQLVWAGVGLELRIRTWASER